MPYKILSLDGGGSWALIQARVLAKLYGDTTSGLDILKDFDLVVGNSGGTLNIGGMATGRTPQDMVNLFMNRAARESIFVSTFYARLTTLAGFGARYDASKKLPGLRKVFNDTTPPWLAVGDVSLDKLGGTIGCSKTDLMFVGFDYDRKRAQFFRTNNRSPASSSVGPQPTLAEAIHASSNAPVNYFDAPAQFQSPDFAGRRYWDGAITGYNNPILAGVSEALALGVPASDIRVLSIGTAGVLLPMPAKPIPQPDSRGQNDLLVKIAGSGVLADVKNLTGAILDDPPDQDSFIAHLITSGATALSQDPATPSSRYVVRMNPLIQPRVNPASGGDARWVPPVFLPDSRFGSNSTDREAFQALVRLDMDAIDDDQVAMIDALCDGWFESRITNQPIRANTDLQCQIGHKTFHDAWTAWYVLVSSALPPTATNPLVAPSAAPAINLDNMPP